MCTRIPGSYDRVVAFARRWRQEQQEQARSSGCGTFIPLRFAEGEAFRFDWSEDWAVIAGERTKLQVAQFKLGHSRAFFLREYLLQTHEMRISGHRRRPFQANVDAVSKDRRRRSTLIVDDQGGARVT